MTVLTAATVFRKYATDGVPESGVHDPKKEEVIQLLENIQNSGGAAFSVASKTELETIVPAAGAFPRGEVLDDTTPANNGVYAWDGSDWTRARSFSDTMAVLTSIGGDENSVTASSFPGIDPANVIALVIQPALTNTGNVTLSINGEVARPVLDVNGADLAPGLWTAGRMIMLVDNLSEYRLLSDPDADGAATAAAASAVLAEYWATLSEAMALADGSIGRPKIDTTFLARIGIGFDSVADLLADTTLDYSAGDYIVAAGDIITAGGFRYTVASSAATVITSGSTSGYHLITAGGVKLFVDRIVGVGFNVRAFGALGDYDDDTTAFQRALWALKPGGGGRLYVPNGGYYIHTTLQPAPDCAGIHISGEGKRATLIAWANTTAGNLFSWNSDLDHVFMENMSLGNVANCDRLIIIACVRSTFRHLWLRPTSGINTALIAATTGVTTYNLTFDSCHFESVSQAELNPTGLDVPRGHTLNVINCFFSGIRYSLVVGSASESVDGVNISGTRFELFSGAASDRPGATDSVGINMVNARGFSVSGCNFELAADVHASSSGHRAMILREKAFGGEITGSLVVGHGVATGAIEVAHASAAAAAFGNLFNSMNGYGIVASSGSTSQVFNAAGSNYISGGTTAISA